MLMLLYSFALLLALLLSAPWWGFRMLTTQRYREGLHQRLGRVPPAFRALCLGKRVVWIHAVSVGEVLAASSLLADLEAQLGSGWQIVVSTTTRSGQQLARKRFGPGRVFYFPLDFRFAVHCWLRVLQPRLLLLIESELWPRLLLECARRGIPVAVVNARVSDRSLRRALRFRPVWRWMTQHITLWLAQSEQDAGRLVRLGAPPDRIRTTGNLKYDTRPPREGPLATAIRNGAAGRVVVVAGSTVAYGTTPEEIVVLHALRSAVWPEMPEVLLVLAPRHPERFSEADVLAKQFGTSLCASDLLRTEPGRRVHERVLILDTIGDLAAVYRIADIAFVGGSLLPHGGHNPLEPAQFGVPVVMGPHFENFRDIVAKLQAAEGIVVLDGTGPETLGRALHGLLQDPASAEALGERGRAVCEAQKGATARSIAALLPFLQDAEDSHEAIHSEAMDSGAPGQESPASASARWGGDPDPRTRVFVPPAPLPGTPEESHRSPEDPRP